MDCANAQCHLRWRIYWFDFELIKNKFIKRRQTYLYTSGIQGVDEWLKAPQGYYTDTAVQCQVPL